MSQIRGILKAIFHHPQILLYSVFFLLPVSEAKMRRHRQRQRMEQIAHCVDRRPNVGVIAAGLGGGILRIQFRGQVFLKVFAFFARGKIESMQCPDVPVNHIM